MLAVVEKVEVIPGNRLVGYWKSAMQRITLLIRGNDGELHEIPTYDNNPGVTFNPVGWKGHNWKKEVGKLVEVELVSSSLFNGEWVHYLGKKAS